MQPASSTALGAFLEKKLSVLRSGEFWVATPVHLAELEEETGARISPEEME
ncbi:MAG: hypothetical protein HY586_01740 [Candidatus Omnitrophica bacterium]|nr:hypothetical protein [Candidatus Omnitrophota bacterium]